MPTKPVTAPKVRVRSPETGKMEWMTQTQAALVAQRVVTASLGDTPGEDARDMAPWKRGLLEKRALLEMEHDAHLTQYHTVIDRQVRAVSLERVKLIEGYLVILERALELEDEPTPRYYGNETARYYSIQIPLERPVEFINCRAIVRDPVQIAAIELAIEHGKPIRRLRTPDTFPWWEQDGRIFRGWMSLSQIQDIGMDTSGLVRF